MEFIIGSIVGLVFGAAIGFLAARLKAGAGAAERVRLATQIEERERRAAEMEAELRARDAALQAAAERRAELESALVRAETQCDAVRRAADEKLADLARAREEFEKVFKALAGDTLKTNSEAFLLAARRELLNVIAQADAGLEKRREAIEKAIQPLSDALRTYDAALKEVEKARADAYGGLRQQVSELARQHGLLQKETVGLTNVLRNPRVQGQWGELSLRRAVEIAGMAPHCDFEEQLAVSGESGRQRPDMVIHLPNHCDVVVDAKAPLTAYAEACNASDEAERAARLREHAAKVRDHVRRLSSKDYARQFPQAPEFIVLYLPGENFYAAALQADPALLEDALQAGVVPAAPTTLIALLQAVARGWREERLAQEAQQISDQGRLLYERLGKFAEHLAEVGARLDQAAKAYNQAAASFDTRLRPAADRMRALGVPAAKEIVELPPVANVPRLSNGAPNVE